MSAKWHAIKKDGTYIGVGFYVDPVGDCPGCDVEEYDEPQADIIASVKAHYAPKKKTPLLDLDPEALTLDDLKVVVEFLQEQYG